MCKDISAVFYRKDYMYEQAFLHDEGGDWQMIFGVNTIPAYRNRGFAGTLIQCAISDAKQQKRKGLGVQSCTKCRHDL